MNRPAALCLTSRTSDTVLQGCGVFEAVFEHIYTSCVLHNRLQRGLHSNWETGNKLRPGPVSTPSLGVEDCCTSQGFDRGGTRMC